MQIENHLVYGWFSPKHGVPAYDSPDTPQELSYASQRWGTQGTKNITINKSILNCIEYKAQSGSEYHQGHYNIWSKEVHTNLSLAYTLFPLKNQRHCFLVISEILLSFHDSHVIAALGI